MRQGWAALTCLLCLAIAPLAHAQTPDTVFLEGLELYCVIGVHKWERQATRRVRLDVDVEFDCRPAGVSDEIADAVDYRAVAKAVQRLVEGSTFRLVEALAESVASGLLESFPQATRIRVRLAKPEAINWVAAAGVDITRRRDGARS